MAERERPTLQAPEEGRCRSLFPGKTSLPAEPRGAEGSIILFLLVLRGKRYDLGERVGGREVARRDSR